MDSILLSDLATTLKLLRYDTEPLDRIVQTNNKLTATLSNSREGVIIRINRTPVSQFVLVSNNNKVH